MNLFEISLINLCLSGLSSGLSAFNLETRSCILHFFAVTKNSTNEIRLQVKCQGISVFVPQPPVPSSDRGTQAILAIVASLAFQRRTRH